MEILGYNIEPTLLIGIIQILIGLIGLFCMKPKNIADQGSFVNAGTNNAPVHIDNSQNEHRNYPRFKFLSPLFIVLIVIGLVVIASGYFA